GKRSWHRATRENPLLLEAASIERREGKTASCTFYRWRRLRQESGRRVRRCRRHAATRIMGGMNSPQKILVQDAAGGAASDASMVVNCVAYSNDGSRIGNITIEAISDVLQ